MPARDDAGEKGPQGRICEKTRKEKRFHPYPGGPSGSANEGQTLGVISWQCSGCVPGFSAFQNT